MNAATRRAILLALDQLHDEDLALALLVLLRDPQFAGSLRRWLNVSPTVRAAFDLASSHAAEPMAANDR